MSRRGGTRAFADAFTLVEIIVALAVLSTAVIAIFGAMRVCSTAAHHARMLTQAVLLAETQLVNTKLSDNKNFGTREGKRDMFRWQVHIRPTEIDDLAAIKVDITWHEQQRPQHYELLSLIKMKSFVQNRF